MAQESATETLDQPSAAERLLSKNVSFSKLNAEAPDFVPMRCGSGRSDGKSQCSQKLVMPRLGMAVCAPPPGVGYVYRSAGFMPIQNLQHQQYLEQYHHGFKNHHNQFYGVHWEREEEVEARKLLVEPQDHGAGFKNVGPSEEIAQKVVNQVEYYFSDLNLATTDHLMRFINKDPEGYVPISVVASFKKIKAFTSSHSQLASILRKSTKLVVSEDGKRIKRQYPLTEGDLEELQSRIVVAENLPEDHCHQNLMKIFSAVGSLKTIRTCQPQPNNGSSSLGSRSAKADGISNKLHAFVEYATVELAEKAVAELNGDRKWRSGLRVKLFPRYMVYAQNHTLKDFSMLNTADILSHEQISEENANDSEGAKKGHLCGQGKGRGRGQLLHHHNRHILSNVHLNMTKQPPGPRMPDGSMEERRMSLPKYQVHDESSQVAHRLDAGTVVTSIVGCAGLKFGIKG